MSKKRKANGFFFNFAIVFLLISLLLLSIGIVREYLKQKELDREVITLEQELDSLNLNKKNFLTSIDDYQREFFVEQEARTKFNLKKPGESVVIIPSTTIETVNENKAQLVEGSADNLKKNLYLENISSWVSYFFGTESLINLKGEK